MKTRIRRFVLVLSSMALWLGAAGPSGAIIEEMDSDYPFTMDVGATWTADGNPLDRGDAVYRVSGTYRFFRGDLGVGASLGYASPSTDFLPGVDEDADLLLLDFDLVWYVNYAQQQKIWQGQSRIKPEVTLFAGPGVASLRIKDAFPRSQLNDAGEHFFTLNAGVGVNLHLFEGDHRTTSRKYLRFEAVARWFNGDDDTVDWGGGIAFGYGFGRRPSCRALALRVEEVERLIKTGDDAFETTLLRRGEVEELKAQVTAGSPRCAYLRERLNNYVGTLNRTLTGLRQSGTNVD